MTRLTWGLSLFASCFYGPLLVLNLLIFAVRPSEFHFVSIAVLVGHVLIVYFKYRFDRPFSWFSMFFYLPAFWSRPNEIWKLKSGKAHFYRGPSPQSPCVLVIFGGGFIAEGPGQLSYLQSFLRSQGFHVVALPYQNLPDGVWPRPLNDLIEGTKEVMELKRADFLPQEFHLLGRSAGGYLAGQLSHSLASEEKIKSVSLLYPIIDIMAWSQEPGSNAILKSEQIVKKLLINETPTYPDLTKAIQPQTRKFFILSGDFDPFVDPVHSVLLAESLDKTNHSVKSLTLPYQTHGFDVSLYSMAGQKFRKEWLRFLTT